MPRVVFVLVVLLLSSCKSGTSKLEGKWKGTKAEGIANEAQAAEANLFATQMALEVKGDTLTISYPKDVKQTGRFSVRRSTDSMLVIATDKDGPAVEETFTFFDDKTMKWDVLSGKTITFTRE